MPLIEVFYVTIDLNEPVTEAVLAAVERWLAYERWSLVRVCPFPSCGICGGGGV